MVALLISRKGAKAQRKREDEKVKTHLFFLLLFFLLCDFLAPLRLCENQTTVASAFRPEQPYAQPPAALARTAARRIPAAAGVARQRSPAQARSAFRNAPLRPRGRAGASSMAQRPAQSAAGKAWLA